MWHRVRKRDLLGNLNGCAACCVACILLTQFVNASEIMNLIYLYMSCIIPIFVNISSHNLMYAVASWSGPKKHPSKLSVVSGFQRSHQQMTHHLYGPFGTLKLGQA